MTTVLAATGVMTLTAGFMVMGTAGAAQAGSDKTNVCHATGSDTNPYGYFSVGSDGGGHVAHRGPVSTNEQEWHETTLWHGQVYLAGTSKFDLVEGYDGQVPSDPDEAEAYCSAPGVVIGDEATAVAPTVVQSPECEVEGTYTIPATPGVQYKLDGVAIGAGTYGGPETGTVTAVAKDGFTLTNPDFSYALNVAAAADCDDEATAVAPTVVQSPECEVEGTYTIPATPGVQYRLDGVAIGAGTYGGPETGTVTAVAKDGFTLTNPGFSYALNVAAAAKCPTSPPPVTDVCSNIDGVQATVPAGYTEKDGVCTPVPTPPPPVTDVCSSIDGVQATVPAGYTEKDGVCTPVPPPPTSPPPPVTDVCSNIDGAQTEVPEGYSLVDGVCVKDEVAPTATATATPKPEPTKAPPVAGPPEAVPTAVDAGLRGPAATSTLSGSPLGQGLVGAGLLMLMLAGSLQLGRRERGAHQA